MARQTRFFFLDLKRNNGAKKGSYFSSLTYEELLGLITFSYAEDGTYLQDWPEGTFDDQSGSWEFNSDASVLTMDAGTADESRATIVDLSDDIFVYTAVDDSLGTLEFSLIR